MKRSFICFVILTMFSFFPQILMCQVKLNIENDHYAIPTKLSGIFIFEDDVQKEFSVSISPKVGSKILLEHDIPFNQRDIKSLAFLLCEDKEVTSENSLGDDEDKNLTALALCNFAPKLPIIESLRIAISERTIEVTPQYKLPPKFN